MEEAPVAVTAATGTLGPVVAKLSTLLRRRGEYRLQRRTRKDVKLIRSKLKSVHSILWVIWEKEDLDAAGKELRMEAWRLADDMNDAIDDFILSMERSNNGKRFMQAKNQPSPFQDLKRRAVDVCERCRNKWKKMETAHTTVSSLFSRTKTTVVDSGPAKWPARVVDPYVHKDISELVGIGEPTDKLIEHLVGEEESTPQLKMASILGAAGMGKTALARLVFEAIQDKFQARAFVSVTSSRNMTEVLASIYQQVQRLADSSTDVPLAGTKAATAEEHLIDVISNFLKDKRYLVIIDDIWHCAEWKTIKKSLPDNNLGSRIVTTSRVNAITNKWRDDFDALVVEIDHRVYENAAFIAQMIDMNVDVVGEGFDHDHGIVNMCCHMPLAVACMISAMAKETERLEQEGTPALQVETLKQQGLCTRAARTRDVQDRLEEQVMRNGIQNTPGFEPLVESFELGYKDLPHHMLKTCLLYCSIYPERHSFNRDGMVRRWIAEGFVCKEEAAKDYFDELVSRRFIHGSLHPMMRNYLRRKLQEDNFITCTSDGVPSSLVGRLCIDYWPSSDAEDPLSGIDWHRIRSLVVFNDAERVPYKDFQHLRVLDIQCSEVLENQHRKDMYGLLCLRHLLLRCRQAYLETTEVPAEIVRLQYLETLEVRGTGITRLPAEIGGLKQLKTLVVSWNYGLRELPREMGNLQHLETLCLEGTNLIGQAWEIILTLKKLKTLNVGCIITEFSAIPRDIGELRDLKNLDVSNNYGMTELPKEIGKLQHLETLDLSVTRLKQLPCEIGNLQRLVYLDLRATAITKVPRDIGKLQHLEYLDLRGTNVKKVPMEIRGLQNLKILMDGVGILPLEPGQLPKLKHGLPMWVRQAWKNSHLVSSLAGEILSLVPCDEQRWVQGGLIVGTKHMHIPQWIKEHFNRIGYLDIRICKLEEVDLRILREMPYLCLLTLRFEAVPKTPIVISSGGFTNLSRLVVDSRVPRVTFQEGAMPSLKWLDFEFQFYGGPPNTAHPMDIKHLVSLTYVTLRCNEWYRGDSDCINRMIHVMREEAQKHPNKIRLLVSGKDEEDFPKNGITQSSEDRSEAYNSSGAEEIEEIQQV